MSDFYNQTTLAPLGLVLVLLFGCSMLLVPTRLVMVPFVAMATSVSAAQRLVIGGLDFNFIRVLILFGLLRLLIRKDNARLCFTGIDFSFLAFLLVESIVYILQQKTGDVVVNRLGFAFEALGLFYLFRMYVSGWDHLLSFTKAVVFICAPVTLIFVVENWTGRNLFSVFGGVPEHTVIRWGRLRCQGPFPHAIMAGVFWASLFPFIVSLWWQHRRILALVGALCVTIVVYTTASSTPVMALGAGCLGLALYPLRYQLRLIRWLTVAVLIALHLSMKAPVWHLIARISAVGGSTGYHRFHLIDQAIRHFPEWMLFGEKNTASWGWGLQDVTNEYLLHGVRGGFFALLLFVAAIALCFRATGRATKGAPSWSARSMLAWGLGVSLFVHCVSFIGVSYFGQITVTWYGLLGIIANIAAVQLHQRPVVAAKALAAAGQAHDSHHLQQHPTSISRRGSADRLSHRGGGTDASVPRMRHR